MKKICLILTIFLVGSLAWAVPQSINYQGVLKNSAGSLESGTFSMVFKIYDAASAGTAVYNSGGAVTSVAVTDGLYNVQLDSVDSSVFPGNDRWLDITVAGDHLSPRLKINSVAYALMASSAEAATTATNANYATLSGTATNAGTVNNISANTTAAANQLYPLDANARLVGIGITAEASGTNYALFINSGKLGVAVGGSGTIGDPHTGCAGSGTIPALSGNVQIYNNLVTDNSLIIVTLTTRTSFSLEPLVPYAVSGGGRNFRVGFSNMATPAPVDVNFNYLVIN